MQNKTVPFNPGEPDGTVAFVFACPGRLEEKAGRVVAGQTGKNLDMVLEYLSKHSDPNITQLFPFGSRYRYRITNACDTVYYPELNGRSLPQNSEIAERENLERLKKELDGYRYIFFFGNSAKYAAELLQKEGCATPSVRFITGIRHLSPLSVNRITSDIHGEPIICGNTKEVRVANTRKRLEIIAEGMASAILGDA